AEPVHHRGLGGAKFDPFRAIELHPFVELLGELKGLFTNLVDPIELALKGELARQRFFQRPAPPYRDGGLTLEVVPEVDHAHGILHLLDRCVVDQRHFGSGPYVYLLQGRERAGDVLDTAVEFNVGRCKHATVRVDAAHPAQAVALEQQLLFELYLVVTTQLRTHVNGCGVLELRGPVFEGQLVARTGPSLVVKSPLSQNEVVVVEVKLRGVIEEHLPNLTVECVLVDIYFKTEFLESLGCCLPKFEKAILAGKPIGLQQNLVLAVMNYVAGEVLRFGMLAYVLIHGVKLHHIPLNRQVRLPLMGDFDTVSFRIVGRTGRRGRPACSLYSSTFSTEVRFAAVWSINRRKKGTGPTSPRK